MKNKLKLAILCMSFCCVLALGIMGVLAVTQIDFVVGGNINFTAKGVEATIEKTEVSTNISGVKEADMKTLLIDTNKTLAQIKDTEEYKSWGNLDLDITDATTSATIKFKVTNNNTTDKLPISASIDTTAAQNMAVTVTPATVELEAKNDADTDEQEFTITFTVTEPDTNASFEGFAVEIVLGGELPPPEGTITQADFEANYEYTLSGDEITITKYLGSETEVSVPAYVKLSEGAGIYIVRKITGTRKSVTDTPVGAFSTSVKKVILPETLTSIGDYCFFNCTSLSSVIIPNGVTEIGSTSYGNTFYGCKDLIEIEIPSSVRRIMKVTFNDCPNLTSVKFVDINGWYVSTNAEATSGADPQLSDSDFAGNAKKLKTDYVSYYWFKGE